MTSQEDQEFMDVETEPSTVDEWEHFWGTVEEFVEKGWDVSRLQVPGSVSEAKSRIPDNLNSEEVEEMLEEMQSGDDVE